MKQNNKYQKASRARKEKAGYIRKEYWIKPKWDAKVKKLIESLKCD